MGGGGGGSAPMASCTPRTWPAAHALAEYAAEAVRPTARVLELGAGLGDASLRVAQAHRDVRITATDTNRGDPDVLERLARNVAAAGGDVARRVAVEELDWDDADDVRRAVERSWDVVMGADLVYSKQGAESLCKLLGRFAHATNPPGAPTILLAHSTGRWGAYGFDAALLEELDANRLLASPVGAPTPGANPGESIVVFSITGVARVGSLGSGAARAGMERALLRARREHDAREARRWSAMPDDERAEAAAAGQLASLLA